MDSFDNSHGAVRFLRGLSPHFQPDKPPQTYEEYIDAYGVNRHDAFITAFQDDSGREAGIASFEDLTSEHVVLVLTRAYEQVKSIYGEYLPDAELYTAR